MPGRALLLGAAAGLVVLLAIPVVASLGAPAPLTGSAEHAVSGQEPTPPGSAGDASTALRVPPIAPAPESPTPTPAATARPATPRPATPVPATPVPATARPATPVPATPVPATARPATPVPTATPTAVPTRVPAATAKATPDTTSITPSAGREPAIPSAPLAAAWTTTTSAPPIDTLTGYRWPLAHPRLTLPFGPTPWGSRLVNGQTFHDGVDLATFCNDRVMAAHSGTVLAAGRHYDRVMGWIGTLGRYFNRLDSNHLWKQLPIVVVIDDGNGYRSMYAHMWKLTVKKGDSVKAGQLIGYEGRTGRASGCHVHYGLFSPLETATFGMKPDVVKRMRLPKREIARVDPLVILPKKAGINAPKKPKADDTASSAPAASPVSASDG